MRPHLRSVVLLVLAASALTLACGAERDEFEEAAPDPVALQQVGNAMGARLDAMQRQFWHNGWHELLPNVKWKEQGQPGFRMSDVVVIGSITEVKKGFGFYSVAHPDEDQSVKVAFDDPASEWRTIHVTIAVDEAHPEGLVGEEVTVGLPFVTDDFTTTAGAYKAMGKIAALLMLDHDSTGPYSYDASLKRVAEQGTAIMQVSSTGTLTSPFAPDPALVSRLTDLETLRRVVDGDPQTILLVREGNVLVRPRDPALPDGRPEDWIDATPG